MLSVTSSSSRSSPALSLPWSTIGAELIVVVDEIITLDASVGLNIPEGRGELEECWTL